MIPTATTRMSGVRREVLDLYPIGSEWYDCAHDICGRVILHVESRGVLMRSLTSAPTWLMAFGYDALMAVPARLIAPREGGYYHQWRKARSDEVDRYNALLKEQDLADEPVWG